MNHAQSNSSITRASSGKWTLWALVKCVGLLILQRKPRYVKKFTPIARFSAAFLAPLLLVLALLFAYIPFPLKRQTVRCICEILIKWVLFKQKFMKEELDYVMWVTSGIRFSQSSRYEKIESTIYFSLLMMSVYLTIVSLITPTFFSEQQSVINLFILSVSIIITILVVLLKGAKFTKRSRQQHECGRKIRKLLYDLKSAVTEEEIENISTEYNSILDDFENHSKVDLSYFWYENFNKVDDTKKRKAPNGFHRNIIAPLVFTVFPITTKLLVFLAPPIIFVIIVV